MSKLEGARLFWSQVKEALTPSEVAWQGASVGIRALVAALVLAFFVSYFVQDFTLQKLPAFFVSVGALFLLGALALLLVGLVGLIPVSYRIALFVFAPFVVVVVAPGDATQSRVFSAALLLIVSFVGAGVAVLLRDGFHPRRQKVTLATLSLGLAGLAVGLYAIFGEKDPANPAIEGYVLEDRTLDLPNPGLPGDHGVLTLTYGSGRDRHRHEYGAGADLISRSVDGSKLIDNWDGAAGWLRTSYWGFDATELPLQARVWYPEGDGPFPLVLVVHGNHAMEDFSDRGYGYLGELFASRGIILASVDENFLNSSVSARVDLLADRPGLKEENDARGWVLLQHLAQWRDWNAEPGHLFHGKVDMDRLALIGHSRGGEAVAAAASFNALRRYPDDATLEFDFGFNLRGVIAIAPVDGQYQARDRGTPIRDVSYFTIHGSMDGDVQSFEGTSQYSRVTFSENSGHFKSSLYVTGANHGQFNTTWGNLDTNPFRAWVLDLDGIMEGEAQRDVARVFFSGFLEVVLRDRHEYRPIFRDVRHAAGWLPSTFYVSQYSSSGATAIADFEEDIDPTTTTLAGGRIGTRHLSRWYESRNSLKRDQLDTHAATFAWDERFSEDTARVDFTLPEGWSGAGRGALISASISAADIDTLPEGWETDRAAAGEADNRSDAGDDGGDAEPLDWTVELIDRNGVLASLPLSHDEALHPQVQARPRRASFLDASDPAEVLFRRFELPMDDFVTASPSFDPARLSGISFVFDRSRRGAIVVDDLSLTGAE